MTEEKDTKLKELEEKRDKYVHKIFYLMLEILVIFGAPAVVAYFLGAWLDARFTTEGKTLQMTALAVAFVTSWVITIMKYRRIDRQLKDLDKQISSLRSQQQATSNKQQGETQD